MEIKNVRFGRKNKEERKDRVLHVVTTQEEEDDRRDKPPWQIFLMGALPYLLSKTIERMLHKHTLSGCATSARCREENRSHAQTVYNAWEPALTCGRARYCIE